MRISANLGFLYTELPMTERILAAARDGFDAVEFHWPYDTPADTLRESMEVAGLPGLGINTRRGDVDAGEFGIAAVPGREADARNHIDEAITYATDAGIRAVHIMAGRASGDAAERSFDEALGYACDMAADAGVMILIEPLNTRDVPGYFLTGTNHARRIVERLNRPELRIMYDFYHMQIMQGDHVRHLESLGDLVGHVQIASTPDRTEPDQGELDWAWIVRRVGYSGFIGAEYHPKKPPVDWLTVLNN